MAEIQGVKQVLAQAQVERLQEGARRAGDQQQQGFAVTLHRQADAREHRVNEGEAARDETIDPNAQKGREDEEGEDRRKESPADRKDLPPEEEERGRHVDARA